jgi:hypothetical protein
MLKKDAKPALELKMVVLSEVLQTTQSFKISFLLSKHICCFIQAQFISFTVPPN